MLQAGDHGGSRTQNIKHHRGRLTQIGVFESLNFRRTKGEVYRGVQGVQGVQAVIGREKVIINLNPSQIRAVGLNSCSSGYAADTNPATRMTLRSSLPAP